MSRWPTRSARGTVIRAIRQARGLRQVDVATTAGMSAPELLTHIESGRRSGARWVDALAAALDVPPEVVTGQIPAIATLRDIADVTPAQLAADIGVTPDQLAAYERGTDDPTPTVAARIARRLAVDVDAITPPAAPGEVA